MNQQRTDTRDNDQSPDCDDNENKLMRYDKKRKV